MSTLPLQEANVTNVNTLELIPVRHINSPPFGMDFRTWFEFKAKLARKKNEVLRAAGSIKKSGYNAEHDYHFARETDINDELRELLYQHGLSFDSRVLETRKNGNITLLKMLITWTDCETGYFEEHEWLGNGFDTVDKGIYKSYTGGIKYFLMKQFLISTHDDPEYSDSKPRQSNKSVVPDLPVRQLDEPTNTHIQPEPETTKEPETKQEEVKPEVSKQNDAQPEVVTTRKTRTKTKVKEDTLPKDQEQPQEEPKEEVVQNSQDVGKVPQEPPQELTDDKYQGLTPELVGEIKTRIISLSGFSDETNKKKARDAIMESLALKLKTDKKDYMLYTGDQAKAAIPLLDGWLEQKKEAKRMRDEAIARQIEQQRAKEGVTQ
jgi:outer membrane biosynthesis protein TonB